jgi:hypothetical protein
MKKESYTEESIILVDRFHIWFWTLYNSSIQTWKYVKLLHQEVFTSKYNAFSNVGWVQRFFLEQ